MLGKFVAGEGPIPAEIMIVGEGPGKYESSLGRPFVGLSGSELNRYLLMQAGLHREDIFITNIVRYRTDEDNRDPNQAEIERDEPYLKAELEAVKPRIIVPVGRIAAQYFLGSDVNLEFVYGLPQTRPEYPDSVIVPLYHPAAGIHQADKFSKLVYNGFKLLGQYAAGDVALDVRDFWPNPLYQEAAGRDIEWPYGVPPLTALDTEGLVTRPWGLSYSHQAGRATVVPAYLAPAMNKIMAETRPIFHNALWDLKVLRAMGVNVPYDKLEDTMIMAHLLCVEPKKLKALAYRHARMEMENFKDVIRDADDRISRTYLEHAHSFKCPECGGAGALLVPWKKNPNKTKVSKCPSCRGDKTIYPRPEPELVFEDDFTAKIYQAQGVGRRLSGLLQSGSSYRQKWEEIDPSIRKTVEEKVGTIPEVTLDDVEPRDRAVRYSARDADATLRVYHTLRPRITQMGLEKAYEIDKGCIPIIDRMHQNGILINKDYLVELDNKFAAEQLVVLQKMHDEIGVYFNPSSPIQMKKELAKLGLRDLESTNERTLKLKKLESRDPKTGRLIDYALDYRELKKMRGTYTYPLIRQADENSRIHTTFILSAQEKGDDTAEAPSTGRLSSRDPNLQNIPVATDRGNLIRAGFIAKPGCVLLSNDLSQIELRVGAHLAQEANMIDAFRSGRDLHTLTASRMFGVPYDRVDPKKHRYPAKTISFGIFYGMSKYRLQSELALEGLIISLDEAQAFIDAWFDAYPGIRSYMHRVQAEARQNSYVRTLFGHIRYLPNVHCKDDRIREEALRQAGNHPVQGTAGEILKIAMANIHAKVYPEFKIMGYYFEPLLTIHDELIFEVEAGAADLASAMVAYEMENAVKLLVPLTSSFKIAGNWSELK